MKTLSIKEALSQGYTKFLFNSDGFQSLRDISDVNEKDLAKEDIRLVEIEPYCPAGISSKDIAELLAEHIECNHVDQSQDDTEKVYGAIKNIDFTEAENKISEALSSLHYFRASDIKLVADIN